MFTGVYQHQIDAKGRTSLPSAFRDVLAGQGTDKLFVTTDIFGDFLLAFAPEQWNAFMEKIYALPQFDDQTRTLVRTVVSPAQECPFDKLGRILLPPSLREHAGLSDQVTWAGSGRRIEIWNPAGWAKTQAEARTPESKAALKRELGRLL